MPSKSRSRTLVSSSINPSKSPTPAGILLVDKGPNEVSFRIGPLIAKGAFGAVHHVVAVRCDNNDTDDSIMTAMSNMTSKDLNNDVISGTIHTTEWVAKVVPVPNDGKKKDKDAGTAYRILYHERSLYLNHFTKHCGTLLPSLPRPHITNGLDVYYDNVGGAGKYHNNPLPTKYRCLLMERMECSLYDALPALLADLTSSQHPQQTTKSAMGKVKATKSSGTVLDPTNAGSIDIGSIAVRLIRIAETLHSCQHLILDVKPDNIMVAFNANACSKSSNSKRFVTTNTTNSKTIGYCASSKALDTLIDRIRLVDLGLVKCYLGPDGHLPNDGIEFVVGTPQYASLNVHDLQTPSRRDDIESLIYVIGEIIIRVQTILKRHTNLSETPTIVQTDLDSCLPWSIGKSDAQVGEIKRLHVSDINSEYYQRMMSSHNAQILMECWCDIRKYSYTMKPRYDELCERLKTLSIPISINSALRSSLCNDNLSQNTNIAPKITPTKPRANEAKPSPIVPPISSTKLVHRLTRNSTKTSPSSTLTQQRQQQNQSTHTQKRDDSCDDVEDKIHNSGLGYHDAVQANDTYDDMEIDEDEGEDCIISFHSAYSSLQQTTAYPAIFNIPVNDNSDVKKMVDISYRDPETTALLEVPLRRNLQFGEQGLKLCLSHKNAQTATYFFVKDVVDSIVVGSSPQQSKQHMLKACSSLHTTSRSMIHKIAFLTIPDDSVLPCQFQLIYHSEQSITVLPFVSSSTSTKDGTRTVISTTDRNNYSIDGETLLVTKISKSGTTAFVGQSLCFADWTIELCAIDSSSESSNSYQLAPIEVTTTSSPSMEVENQMAVNNNFSSKKYTTTRSAMASVVHNQNTNMNGSESANMSINSAKQNNCNHDGIVNNSMTLLKKSPTLTTESVKAKKNKNAITVQVQNLDHCSDSKDYVMEESGCKVYIIGSNPTIPSKMSSSSSSDSASIIVLPSVPGILPTHAKLEYTISPCGRFGMVNVTDLTSKPTKSKKQKNNLETDVTTSSSKVTVNGRPVSSGKSMMAFRGHEILIGLFRLKLI